MRDIFSYFEGKTDASNFSAIRISIASPDQIREWSHGEVKKPETINYRTYKPERDGLFCARIFGPVKDYECICGKYKRMKHRGVVCEKCGVEVIQSKVRRERLGHINLACPVSHIWFLKSLPSRIGHLLDIQLKDVERVLYHTSYIVTDPGISPLQIGEVLKEKRYADYLKEYGQTFQAKMGAAAIQELLEKLDVERIGAELRAEMKEAASDQKRKRIAKRLKIIEAIRDSRNEASWMILDVIPVLPPDLRPLVPLEGGRFATSDLNDLYRRVINRNNRLRRLIELRAPELILQNEKRMLQEAVDGLFDNGKRSKPIAATSGAKRPLKSLAEMIKGKAGRFRQNLLGKRVDYSGRSVIVCGPALRLHQCGLPKQMALELYKPFIYNRLEEKGYASTIKSAKKLVEKEETVVWDVLDEVIKEHPVLLNRAPTLHRLGIQAFEPVLIEGKAIQVHPLVCAAYNADFDGDQMAVHLPLSLEAQVETRVLLLSTNNILSPASGSPVIGPTQDIVLGCYYMTRVRPFAKGCYREDENGRPIAGIYANRMEVQMAYDAGELHLQAEIKVRIKGELVKTTTGRVIFSNLLPEGLSFDLVNQVMGKKQLGAVIDVCFREVGSKATVLLADAIRSVGYTYSTLAGVSISVDDMKIPAQKWEIIQTANQEIEDIQEQYGQGTITDNERYNKVVDVWTKATEDVAEAMSGNISETTYQDPKSGATVVDKSFNSIFMMADSGARGSAAQMKQLAGMRGVMAKPSGEIIETPITANFREGLTVLEYFISTHGARKGLADTALKTASSGYLTRRLVDVANDCTVLEYDCGTLDGVEMERLMDGGNVIESLADRVLGRVALEPVWDQDDNMIVDANTEIDEEKAEKIAAAKIERIKIRSALTCDTLNGVCALCYGRDLARGRMTNVGEAVGTVAAQSIGEPGTQLTMRTFHIGGVGSLEAKRSSHEATVAGTINLFNMKAIERKSEDGRRHWIVTTRNAEYAIIDEQGRERERFKIEYGAKIYVNEGQNVEVGDTIAQWEPFSTPVLTQETGIVKFEGLKENESMAERYDEGTGFTRKVIIESRNLKLRPQILIQKSLEDETILAQISLPAGAELIVDEHQFVNAGDVIAKIPRETTKNRDITGGLPRVAALFEARSPKDKAIVSEIDGIVSFGRETKQKRAITVTPEIGEPVTYQIPKSKHVQVVDGDHVKVGEPLMEGDVDPEDILNVKGRKELAKYMVDEIQEVYRLQGVRINDKHIEIIVRQMLRKVRITEVGDTEFLTDEQVERNVFEKTNRKIIAKGGRPAVAADLLLGITKASLSTESFISASSFQETTKVLTEAAMESKIDNLIGLKENVIMGRLIPAGTGAPEYQNLDVEVASRDAISSEMIDRFKRSTDQDEDISAGAAE